jgi:alpha-mannosidase
MPAIYGKQAAAPLMMYLYGVGDHGGGPTRTMLDTAGRLMKEDAVFPKLEFSTSAAFFADVEKKMPELHVPTWSNELYFQHHRGVFTTQAETKTRIRHTEETLLDAEKYASIAELYGEAYPKEKLRTAWKGLLFDQFHDIMPGSGIAANYVDAQRDLENVERTGNEIRSESLNEISTRIDTQHEGVPVVVYNSLSWPRTEVIDVSVQMPTPVREIEVVDSRGKIAPAQLVGNDAATHRLRLLLQAKVPTLGYETYFVREARQIEASAPSGAEVKATPSRLENEFVRVEVDSQTGCITSLFDKRSKREALAKSESDTGGPADKVCGNLLQTFADNPKEYDAWNIDADFEKQHWDLDKADDVKLAEAGPLRAVIRVKHHFQNSTFVQDITLYAGVPRVDVKMQTEWREKHILLKVGFPVSVHSKTATFEIPYGAIERPTTRATPEEQAQFEVPAQHWADLSDEQHGLSLLNNCKYGYDAKANVLRLSLLRSPAWPDPHADEGHHEFTYSVYAHGGTWREADTVRRGYELNYNLIATQVQNHTGDLAPSHSFLQIAGGNVVLTAMKWAEDRDAMILRFYEWAGSEADITLQLPPGAQDASETNLIEQPLEHRSVANGAVTVHTKPYEIKTVEVRFSAAPQPSGDR